VSNVAPTAPPPAPRANGISVVEGSRDTIRTRSTLGCPR
jgi:hypothetical protein